MKSGLIVTLVKNVEKSTVAMSKKPSEGEEMQAQTAAVNEQFANAQEKIRKGIRNTQMHIEMQENLLAMVDVAKHVKNGELNEQHFNWYCRKTGKLIRALSTQEIADLVYTHGLQRAREILQNYHHAYHVDPMWQFTDGTALDRLLSSDPIGYYCYAASQLYQRKAHRTLQEEDKVKRTPEFLNALINAKATLHRRISKFPLNDIIHANRVMQTYLSINSSLPENLRQRQQLRTLTPKSVISALTEEIKVLIMRKVKQDKLSQEVGENIRAHIIRDPASNFASQRRITTFSQIGIGLRQLLPQDMKQEEIEESKYQAWRLQRMIETGQLKAQQKKEEIASNQVLPKGGFKLKLPIKDNKEN